jgi:hypothetical protein
MVWCHNVNYKLGWFLPFLPVFLIMTCWWSVRIETCTRIRVKYKCVCVLLICDVSFWQWCRTTQNYVRKLFHFLEAYEHVSVLTSAFHKHRCRHTALNNMSTLNLLYNQKQDWCLNPRVYLPPFWNEVYCSLLMGDVNGSVSSMYFILDDSSATIMQDHKHKPASMDIYSN